MASIAFDSPASERSQSRGLNSGSEPENDVANNHTADDDEDDADLFGDEDEGDGPPRER